MMNLKKRAQLKWCIYALMIPVLYVIQTTPGLFAIGEVKAMLLIPLAVSVACFEKPLASGVFGFFCGLFTDAASDYLLGFNAMIFLLCCMTISLIHTNFLKSRLTDTLISGLVVLALQRGLDYFFYYSIWALDPNGHLLLSRFLPSALFSFLLCIPFHYLIKWFVNLMQKDDSDLRNMN